MNVAAETNKLLLKRHRYSSFNEYLRAVGMETKREMGFNSQVIYDLTRSIWKMQKGCQHVNGVTVNSVFLDCKTFGTAGYFFVELGPSPRSRIAVPIKRNLNFVRFESLIKDGWTCKTFGLTPYLEIHAIDINNENFAYTVLTPEGEILKEGYLGQ